MLLLFNKTIKSLNQFAKKKKKKKNPKEVSAFGTTADNFLTIFAIDINNSNIYREKVII